MKTQTENRVFPAGRGSGLWCSIAPQPVAPVWAPRPATGCPSTAVKAAGGTRRRQRFGYKLVFDYYNRLTARQQSIYRQSDAIRQLRLPRPADLHGLVVDLEPALKSENRKEVERLCQLIAQGIVSQLQAPALRVQVLAVRPSDDWGELHGLYLPEDSGKEAKIQVWMRTAKHKKVVAFRSFLRTLLHELCHHLDYEYFNLPETFHTEGFYNRESSLFHQLVPEARTGGQAVGKEGNSQA